MSNRIYIEKVSGPITDAALIYDDHDRTFVQFDTRAPDDDLQLLAKIVEDGAGNDSWEAFVTFINDNHKGIYINDEYYEYDRFKEVINT